MEFEVLEGGRHGGESPGGAGDAIKIGGLMILMEQGNTSMNRYSAAKVRSAYAGVKWCQLNNDRAGFRMAMELFTTGVREIVQAEGAIQ